jgi:hypothetical protein
VSADRAPADPDPLEALYARGVTDGLPVVPATAARVAAAVAASGRARDELIALVAPRLGRATVEKIAINAVMAGCRAEYLPAVIAGVEAICDPAFALVGVSGTTDAVALLLIINGPVRAALDVNSGAGAFGPGWRANATIGRAVRLVWQNVGGAAPGVISMSTFSQPGRYSYCIGENEEASPWEPLHVEHGFAAGESTVAAVAAEAPQVVANTESRTGRDILATIARSGTVQACRAAIPVGGDAREGSRARRRQASGARQPPAGGGGGDGGALLRLDSRLAVSRLAVDHGDQGHSRLGFPVAGDAGVSRRPPAEKEHHPQQSPGAIQEE